MLEMKDGKKILTTPISAEDLKDIHAGDIVYLNGSMTTCRDVAHRRLVEEGRELPVNVKDAVRNGICRTDNQYAYGKIRIRIRKRDRRSCYHR